MVLLLLWLGVHVTFAQTPNFYKITPPKKDVPCSYILGGSHYADHKLLPPVVFNKIKESSIYFVETENYLTSTQSTEIVMVMNLEDNFHLGLKTVITPEAFEEVKKYFSYFSNVTEEKLNRISPEDLVTFIQMSHLFVFYHAKNQCFDFNMAKFAISQCKTLKALETAEELRQFANKEEVGLKISREKAITMLNDLPDLSDTIRKNSAIAIRKANQLLLSDEETLQDFLGPLIDHPMHTDRNLNWLPSIVRHCNQTSCFFTVGAAHLYGPGGLLALLRQQGFTISQIKDK